MLVLLFVLPSSFTICSAIINGTIPHRFWYPFMVSLQWDRRHKCGGVLLNADTILTVAHCFPLIWVDPLQQHRVSALLGTSNQFTSYDFGVERVGIRRIIWPDDFQVQYKSKLINEVNLERVPNDYMLLKTNHSIRSSHVIRYANLGANFSGNFDPKIGDKCIVIGWGRYQFPDSQSRTTESFSQYLRRGLMEIVHNSYIYCSTVSTMFCAKQVFENGDPKGMPCFGDSGSPMVCRNERGYEYLAGLAEAAVVPFNNNRAGGAFMRISTAMHWIINNLS